jgi:hypothetical protein
MDLLKNVIRHRFPEGQFQASGVRIFALTGYDPRFDRKCDVQLPLTDRSRRFHKAFACNLSSRLGHLRDKVPCRQLILHLDNPEQANHRLKIRRWRICSAGSPARSRGSAAAHIPPMSNLPGIMRQRCGASFVSYLLRASASAPSFVLASYAVASKHHTSFSRMGHLRTR